MTDEMARLKTPLDAVQLIHEALRNAACQVKEISGQLKTGNSLQGFKLAFDSWAMALVFHLNQEDIYVESSLTNALSSGGGESNHAKKGITRVLLAFGRVGRREQMEMIEDVFSVLYSEIGNTSLITRTIQHLHRRIVQMGTTQDNHFEIQEALVLPLLREGMDECQQLELIKNLLIDNESDDPRWIIDLVSQQSDSSGKIALAELESKFANV